MGVYINMEMPTEQVLAIINPDGLVEILNSDNVLIEEFQATQVPSHGRLIDADAMEHGVFLLGVWYRLVAQWERTRRAVELLPQLRRENGRRC